MKLKIPICLLLALFLTIIAVGCNSGNTGYRQAQGMIWNTAYHVTYKGDPSLSDSILLALNKVGNSVNYFDSLSTLSRWNRGETSTPDNYLTEVYLCAREVNKLTGGYFDPTLGPLIDAWGFGRGHTATADTARIDEILTYVGMTKTRLENDNLLKDDPRISMNLSAIAKGYGCDKVGEMLLRNGVADYLVEIGGEIACHGVNPSGGKWRISVDRPIKNNSAEIHESQLVIEIADCGVATSGNYRNYQEVNGVEVGHTISPFTGRPAMTDVLSATVIAPTAMEADAFATSFMAMGADASKKLAQERKMAVMLVLSGNEVWISDEFKKYVVE